jgi:hypothetical protein
MADGVRDRIEYGPGWTEAPSASDPTGFQKFGGVIEAIMGRDPLAYNRRMHSIKNRNLFDSYQEMLLERGENPNPLSPGEQTQLKLWREATGGGVTPARQFPWQRKRSRRLPNRGHGLPQGSVVVDELLNQEGQYDVLNKNFVEDPAYQPKHFRADPQTGEEVSSGGEWWVQDQTVGPDGLPDPRGVPRPRWSGSERGVASLTKAQIQDRDAQLLLRKNAYRVFDIETDGRITEKGLKLLRNVMKAIDDPANLALRRGLGHLGYDDAKAMFDAVITPLLGGEIERDASDPLFRQMMGFRNSYLGEWDTIRDTGAADKFRRHNEAY